MTLAEYLDARRAEVESALDRYLPSSRCPAMVAAAMDYSLRNGGKRLRPILVLAAAEAVADASAHPGESPLQARLRNAYARLELAMPAACAIEMIHTYSLIHDDLPAMDDDELRRGQPTSHVVFGEGMAILAGDGLQAEAFELLAREPAATDPETIARKLRVIGVVAAAAGPAGMVGGQAIDLASDPSQASRLGSRESGVGKALVLDGEALQDMHARKTGALIRASVAAGAIMARADDRRLAALEQYGAAIGLAFQIVDDILDVSGASADLGKTAGKDAAAGKPTYPSLYGLDRSRQLAEDCRTRALDALSDAGLAGSRLADIAGWIIERRT